MVYRDSGQFLVPYREVFHVSEATKQCFKLRETEDVAVVTFTTPNIVEDETIQLMGSQLFRLVDEKNCKKILVDFSMVKFLSAAALGKLITLEKKVKGRGSKLELCEVIDPIYEVFAITKLNKFFCIEASMEDGLRAF